MESNQVRITGTVRIEIIDIGSKSERPATIIITPSGMKYILRGVDDPAFGSTAFDNLIGATIIAEGTVRDRTFLVRKWTIND